MRHVLSLAVGSALLIAALPQSTQAATTSTTMPVVALVAESCVVTALPMDFLIYDPTALSANTAQSAITVICTVNTPVSVALSQGSNPAAGSSCLAPARAMSNVLLGSVDLPYDIYSDAGYTSVWGCDTTNDVDFTSAGLPLGNTLIAYGRIAPGVNASLGVYLDAVQVDVTF